MDKICNNCGSQVSLNDSNCPVCGAEIVTFCPVCGTKKNGIFCAGCGYNFSNVQASQPQQAQIPQPTPIQPQQAYTPQTTPMMAAQQPIQQQPNNMPPQQPINQYYQQPQPVMPAVKAKSSSNLILIIIIIVLLIGGAVGGLYLTRDINGLGLFGASDNKDDSDTKDEDSVKDDSKKSDDEDSSSKATTTKKSTTTTKATTSKPDSSIKDVDKYGIFTDSKFGRGYQIPIAAMMQGCADSDYDTFISAYPKYVSTYQGKLYPTDEDKQGFMDDLNKAYTDKVGDNVAFKCSTTSETKFTADEITKMQNDIKTTYNTTVKIEDAYKVTFSVKITGDDSSASTSITINCIKVNGVWNVIE